MSDIEKRLVASVKIDALNGNHAERDICGKQMLEAATELSRLKEELERGHKDWENAASRVRDITDDRNRLKEELAKGMSKCVKCVGKMKCPKCKQGKMVYYSRNFYTQCTECDYRNGHPAFIHKVCRSHTAGGPKE